MRRAAATAKVNLALVVGPLRADGKHELLTVYQRVALADRVSIAPATALEVAGFSEDTLVRRALQSLAEAAGVEPHFVARIEKRIPVAAGLGGGSSDAATALRLGNGLLAKPLPPARLAELAARLGSDVPFFLENGPQLGSGDGSELVPLDLPQDYWVLLVHPDGAAKSSTASVYEAFDERGGAASFAERRAALLAALSAVSRARDLAELPPNDLASSPLADELCGLGAFRADVCGAGPVVFGLFHHGAAARAAKSSLAGRGRTWLTVPAWYV